MRRQLILVLFVLLTTVALISVQDQASAPKSAAAMLPAPLAILRTSEGSVQPLTLEPIEAPVGPLATDAEPATDVCSLAPTLQTSVGDGGTTDVSNFTQAVDHPIDPVLTCMWGNPDDPKGYRTAWYKLEPDAYGIVSLSTRTSNYDTVLAVHWSPLGTCDIELFDELACNDDDNYFTSRLELEVQAGETYYVEVADWHSAASGQLTLNIESQPQPIDSQWEVVPAGSTPGSARSRHSVVAYGTKLYVIAGQTSVLASNRTPSMYVYDTATGATQPLDSMPGGSDRLGYSNTTAALVNGRIYIPAGYTSLNDGTHWVYDIATDKWLEPPPPPVANNNWADDQPAIHSQATPHSFPVPPGTGYFLSGGLTGSFPVSNSSSDWAPRKELYFYSVSANYWFSYDSMPVGRFGHVAAMQSINGKDELCVAGGMGGVPESNRTALGSTYCYSYSSVSPQWSKYASLNYERYFASSAVDADGNWYVFGGYDNSDNLVVVTERYDPEADQWVVLDPAYSVVPVRAWSRGAFVGDTLWIVGGETVDQGVLDMVQWVKLFRGSLFSYLPLVMVQREESQRYDTFETARRLSLPSSVFDRFYTASDIVNIYYVDAPQSVRIRLDQFNSSNQLAMVVYTANKGFVESRRGPGTVKEVTLGPRPGGYYVAVERVLLWPSEEPSAGEYLFQVLPG